MKLYIDKENLLSLMKSKEQPDFHDCSNLIRKNFDVRYNFPKEILKTNSLLMAWFSNYGQGVNGIHEFANKEEDIFPSHPRKSNFYNSGDSMLLTSVFLLDDDHICELIREKSCILIGKKGEELDVLKGLILDGTETNAIDINSWGEYLPSLPLTDIIICDNHYFKSIEVYKANDNELLRYLCSIPKKSPVNVIIITKDSEVDSGIDLQKEQEEIKKWVKKSTESSKSTVTILTTFKSHDRALITNYYRVRHGCCFHLKKNNVKEDVITEIKSHVYISNEKLSKRLISGIYQSIADSPVRCFGERVSNFLNFK